MENTIYETYKKLIVKNIKLKIARKNWKINNKQKNDTLNELYTKIRIAIKKGDLPSPNTLNCAICNKQAVEYHHYDYTRPFEVTPVCNMCHSHIHHPNPNIRNNRTKDRCPTCNGFKCIGSKTCSKCNGKLLNKWRIHYETRKQNR
ncbi:hypothetical protein M0R04_11100 [Candidatus Dojkabacteria bacterium]|nr:hypothetical protein [Candidatus Dojkabacteria bacterium]